MAQKEGTVLTGSCYVEEIQEFSLKHLEKGCFLSEENQKQAQLLWVTQGCCYLAADGREYTLHRGDLMICSPGQYFVRYTDDNTEATLLVLRFAGRKLPELWGRKFSASPRLEALQTQILEEYDSLDLFGADLLLCLLTQLLLLLQRQGACREEEEEQNPEHEIIRRAQIYVATHIYDRLSVPIVAERASVSASYLTALFRKNLHISPGEYIRRAKLQQSCQLIRENQLNFTEIARVLQYSTVHHFSRQFKENFGISPTEYARSVRESE